MPGCVGQAVRSGLRLLCVKRLLSPSPRHLHRPPLPLLNGSGCSPTLLQASTFRSRVSGSEAAGLRFLRLRGACFLHACL